ncbi:hypothetical protein SSPS47_30190 [Streptomyces sp. S4.7]|nr:hypothetical protein SSPS47_30190 [Streptomyces sp. S4.7]
MAVRQGERGGEGDVVGGRSDGVREGNQVFLAVRVTCGHHPGVGRPAKAAGRPTPRRQALVRSA